MNRITVCAVAAAAIGVTAASARAGVRLDLDGGAALGTSDVAVGHGTSAHRTRSRNGVGYGVGVGTDVNRWVDVGVQFQQSLAAAFLRDGVNLTSITAGPRVYPLGRDHRVRPWVTGQVGWYHGDATVDSLFSSTHEHRTDDGFGFNAGGGLDVQLTPRFSLGTDLRYHQAVGVLDGIHQFTPMVNVAYTFGQ